MHGFNSKHIELLTGTEFEETPSFSAHLLSVTEKAIDFPARFPPPALLHHSHLSSPVSWTLARLHPFSPSSCWDSPAPLDFAVLLSCVDHSGSFQSLNSSNVFLPLHFLYCGKRYITRNVPSLPSLSVSSGALITFTLLSKPSPPSVSRTFSAS